MTKRTRLKASASARLKVHGAQRDEIRSVATKRNNRSLGSAVSPATALIIIVLLIMAFLALQIVAAATGSTPMLEAGSASLGQAITVVGGLAVRSSGASSFSRRAPCAAGR